MVNTNKIISERSYQKLLKEKNIDANIFEGVEKQKLTCKHLASINERIKMRALERSTISDNKTNKNSKKWKIIVNFFADAMKERTKSEWSSIFAQFWKKTHKPGSFDIFANFPHKKERMDFSEREN